MRKRTIPKNEGCSRKMLLKQTKLTGMFLNVRPHRKPVHKWRMLTGNPAYLNVASLLRSNDCILCLLDRYPKKRKIYYLVICLVTNFNLRWRRVERRNRIRFFLLFLKDFAQTPIQTRSPFASGVLGGIRVPVGEPLSLGVQGSLLRRRYSNRSPLRRVSQRRPCKPTLLKNTKCRAFDWQLCSLPGPSSKVGKLNLMIFSKSAVSEGKPLIRNCQQSLKLQMQRKLSSDREPLSPRECQRLNLQSNLGVPAAAQIAQGKQTLWKWYYWLLYTRSWWTNY